MFQIKSILLSTFIVSLFKCFNLPFALVMISLDVSPSGDGYCLLGPALSGTRLHHRYIVSMAPSRVDGHSLVSFLRSRHCFQGLHYVVVLLFFILFYITVITSDAKTVHRGDLCKYTYYIQIHNHGLLIRWLLKSINRSDSFNVAWQAVP